MKKKMILLMALLATMAGVQAQGNSVSVSAVTIPQGGTGSFDIVLNNSEELTGYQMALTLPEGISFVKQVKSERFVEDDHTASWNTTGGVVMLTCLSGNSTALNGNGGTLLTINVSASADLAVNTEMTATLTGVTFVTTPGGEQRDLNDVTFSITIGAPADTHVVLDENSLTEPKKESGVDVRVKRTITAGEWNTICLPFAMSADQVKAVFGNDVLLGDFNGYEVKSDESISVKFEQVSAILANHPYIIKVSTPKEEFEVDGVDVDPQDAEINLGTKRKPKSIIGTYVAETLIEYGCLFLNSGKFWYSTGNTMSKGYRAYFDFDDLLPEFEDKYEANARMSIVFNESVTGVNDVRQPVVTDGRIYNLQGLQVEQPGKGLYIKDGKVIMNK